MLRKHRVNHPLFLKKKKNLRSCLRKGQSYQDEGNIQMALEAYRKGKQKLSSLSYKSAMVLILEDSLGKYIRSAESLQEAMNEQGEQDRSYYQESEQ